MALKVPQCSFPSNRGRTKIAILAAESMRASAPCLYSVVSANRMAPTSLSPITETPHQICVAIGKSLWIMVRGASLLATWPSTYYVPWSTEYSMQMVFGNFATPKNNHKPWIVSVAISELQDGAHALWPCFSDLVRHGPEHGLTPSTAAKGLTTDTS